MRTSVEHRFPSGDPVCEYWLAHCEGFAVESPSGRPAGTIEDVILDTAAESVEALVLARRRRRVALPADRIAAVIPARRTLVLIPKARSRRRGEARRRVGEAAAGARRLGPPVARGGAALAAAVAAAGTALDRQLRDVVVPAAAVHGARALAAGRAAARWLGEAAATAVAGLAGLVAEALAAARHALAARREDARGERSRRA